ncbi:MAG: GNAT family N-acetyltransferase, partial [Candidatus Peregrinibacteria bacterium]
PNQSDKDVINYLIAQDKAYFNLFQIRDGKLIGQENFILQAKDLEDNTQDKEVLEAFLIQYYSLATDIPKEILLPHEITNKTDIQELSNKKISFIIPKIGIKIKLLELSLKNAKIYADRNKPKWYEQSNSTKEAAKSLQTLLEIKTTLKRIECYDISHLSGTDTVGSMIVFKNGAPDSSHYRKFKIKTFDNKPDDCKAIEEVLTRRFSHLQKNSQDYKFRKAIKKDINLLQKEVAPSIKRNHLTYKNFFVLENKKKTTIAFAALRYYKDNKAAQINALWVEPKERGKKLGHIVLKEIIKKSKAKRIYLGSKNSLTDYYLEIGFEIIKHPPKEMLENLTIKWPKEGHTPFVYDTLKHKVDKSFSETPDLVIIDGGKGQLSTASKILAPLKIPYISIAKKFEEIYTPTKKTQISLPQTSDALKLIQRARDEAHRFAINYNQTLRSKKIPKKR